MPIAYEAIPFPFGYSGVVAMNDGSGGWVRTIASRIQSPLPFHLATPEREERCCRRKSNPHPVRVKRPLLGQLSFGGMFRWKRCPDLNRGLPSYELGALPGYATPPWCDRRDLNADVCAT